MNWYDWFNFLVVMLLSYCAPPCRASVREYHCRVLQYVHDSLIVGCLSDRSINPSKGIVAYGIEGDLML